MFTYKLIITKNNEQNKCIKKYTYFKPCMKKYEKLKEENQKVVFPRRYGTHNGLHKVKYNLLLLKRKETNIEKYYKGYTEFGNLTTYKLNDDNWYILDRVPWKVEEQFYVYGLKKRLTTVEIYKQCFLPRMHYFNQVIKIFNKLVIDDGEDLEVILCKTEDDCDLLYQKILSFAHYQNLSSFLFLGDGTFLTRKNLRDRLIEFTGLKRQEFYRNVSKSYL